MRGRENATQKHCNRATLRALIEGCRHSPTTASSPDEFLECVSRINSAIFLDANVVRAGAT